MGIIDAPASAAQLLSAGELAPDFVALAHTGAKVRLSELSNKPVLLVFYDKNGSTASGAVFEALGREWLDLQPHVGLVLALGPHNAIEQAAFATKTQLPFMFVADDSNTLRRAFGVTHAKTPVTSFLVGKDRRILRAGPASANEPEQLLRLLAPP